MSAARGLAAAGIVAALVIAVAPGVARAQAGSPGGGYRSGWYGGAFVQCPPDAGVVGRTRRHAFGEGWNRDGGARLMLRAGAGLQVLATQDLAVRGVGTQSDWTAVPGQQGVGSAWGASFDLAVALFAFGPFYAGGELRFGGGNWREFGAVTDQDAVTLGGGRGFRTYAGLLAVGGVLPFGRLRGRAEIAGGMMDIEADADVTGTYFVGPTHGSAKRTLLEARMGLEGWITPEVSVGALVGMDLLHAPTVSLGVYLQLHTRAFDALLGPAPAAGP